MNRREFVFGTGLTLFGAIGCGSRSTVAHPNCDFDAFMVDRLPAIPPELQTKMASVLAFLREHGWFERLGWSDAPHSPLDQALFDPRRIPADDAFADFAGHRAIHPGRPELSLLYHALASRRVLLSESVPEESYPTLAQLDVLENFIYALQLPPEHNDYVLAVLAYEYRPAQQTPHGRHADLVFSRTGIARIGSEPLNYIASSREFANWPRGDKRSKSFAVTGARYALFLARVVSDAPIKAMTWEKADDDRSFLLPERKIFSGDSLLEGAHVAFGQQHRSERLYRLTQYKLKDNSALRLPRDIDASRLESAPFRRISNTFDKSPRGTNDPSLVDMNEHGDSVVISSKPQALVREAVDSKNRRARFWVPPTVPGVSRQYTTLELNHTPITQTVLEGIALWRRANFIELRRPNDSPMLVNVRFELADETSATIQHLELPRDEARLQNGGYWAALFEDSICDGCVVAAIDPLPKGSWVQALRERVLPAFSLVTAPDFFPNATGLELDESPHEALSENFLKGGTIPLSSVRLPPNRVLLDPTTNAPAFPPNERVRGRSVADTATAVVSRDSNMSSKDATTPDKDRRSGYLPDSASGILYPGWDVTYSGGTGDKFLTTYGLGSPFVEDAKLCAAANGMWPAASPDSARTYQGSLVAVPHTLGLYYSKTATPLTDDELGNHPRSPAVREHGVISERGWDGEYGPYLEVDNRGVWVNYADIGQVDLVANALTNRLDASRLRELRTGDLIDRMEALRRVIALWDSNHWVRQTSLWVIGFERVLDWAQGASAAAIPDLLTGARHPWGVARPGITGPGYLVLLVRAYDLNKQPAVADDSDPMRVRRPCEKMFVTQVARDAVAGTWWYVRQPPTKLDWIDPDA